MKALSEILQPNRLRRLGAVLLTSGALFLSGWAAATLLPGCAAGVIVASIALTSGGGGGGGHTDFDVNFEVAQGQVSPVGAMDFLRQFIVPGGGVLVLDGLLEPPPTTPAQPLVALDVIIEHHRASVPISTVVIRLPMHKDGKTIQHTRFPLPNMMIEPQDRLLFFMRPQGGNLMQNSKIHLGFRGLAFEFSIQTT